MKKKCYLFLLSSFCTMYSQSIAQCTSGLDSVTVQVLTDDYGYESYWELVPGTNNCGVGTLFSGGNSTQVGCSGGGGQHATAGNGYGNLQTVTEGPWCLTDGGTYSILYIDDYGDGGARFIVYINGFPIYHFTGTGAGNIFTFTVTPPLAYDGGMTRIDNHLYIPFGTISISGSFFNYSSNMITSMDLNYSIDGGTTLTQNVSGLSIAPYTSYNFVHPIAWNPAVNGTYVITTWASNLNGHPDMNTSNDSISKTVIVGDPRPNRVDDYLTGTPVCTVFGTAADQITSPRDLDFNPILSYNELWVLNAGTVNTGGSTVTYYQAGEAGQFSWYRQDDNAYHFMELPTAIAFSDNLNFSTTTGILDDNHGGNHFSGPTLWNSDSMIYCVLNGGNGSHIDMLHQSPFSMGIASDSENVFWVYDDFNHHIMRYDFATPHEPGGSDHTDGIVREYTDFTLARINDDIPDHLVLDHVTGQLYIVDGGNQRIIRLDTRSGSVSGTFVPYAEPLAEASVVTGTNWVNYISTGLSQPSGIDVIGNRLIVSDYSNGDIIIYDNTTLTGNELGRIHTGAAGICGIKIGPDGKIWYVNQLQDKVYRIDGLNSVGIGDHTFASQIGIFPNPCHGVLNVSLVSGGKDNQFSVLVRDLPGKEILSTTSSSPQLNLDLDGQAEGIYFVTISNNESSVTEKIILLTKK